MADRVYPRSVICMSPLPIFSPRVNACTSIRAVFLCVCEHNRVNSGLTQIFFITSLRLHQLPPLQDPFCNVSRLDGIREPRRSTSFALEREKVEGPILLQDENE